MESVIFHPADAPDTARGACSADVPRLPEATGKCSTTPRNDRWISSGAMGPWHIL